MEWIVQLPILFFSVMFHEVAHGLCALRQGDDTAQRAGRLTFNPLPHVDLMGTLVLPVFCLLSSLPLVGWAKPVPVSPARMSNRRWGPFRVALAGPVSNLALALLAAIFFRLIVGAPAFVPVFRRNLLNALFFGASINVFLAFFNLLPVHPLDGGKVASALLPAGLRRSYDRHAPYGFMIVMLLVSFGLVHTLVGVPSRLTLELFMRLGLIW